MINLINWKGHIKIKLYLSTIAFNPLPLTNKSSIHHSEAMLSIIHTPMHNTVSVATGHVLWRCSRSTLSYWDSRHWHALNRTGLCAFRPQSQYGTCWTHHNNYLKVFRGWQHSFACYCYSYQSEIHLHFQLLRKNKRVRWSYDILQGSSIQKK